MQTIIGDLINSNPSANIELEALPIIIEALENLENDRLAKEKAKIIEETARQRKLLREKLELNEID